MNRKLFVEVEVALLFFRRKVVHEVPDPLDDVPLFHVRGTQDLVPRPILVQWQLVTWNLTHWDQILVHKAVVFWEDPPFFIVRQVHIIHD